MVIQFGVKEHMKMADTYQWAEQELERQRSCQLEILEDSRRYWKGEAADTLRREQEAMLQEGEYADYLKHVRGMKGVMEESIPRFWRLQQMVAELPTAYGLPCDDMAPETLYLNEEALRKFHELTDEILRKNRYVCEELSSIMDGCEGLVDFGAQRRELEELREEMRRMEEFKRKIDEYADGMRRMDRWMEERLSEYVRIGDGERKPIKEYQFEKQPVTSSDNTVNETNIYFLNDYFDSGEEFSGEEISRILQGALRSGDITPKEYFSLKILFKQISQETNEMTRRGLYQKLEFEYFLITQRNQNEEIKQQREDCMITLCDPVVAYRGYLQEEGFDHIVHLVDDNYPCNNFYVNDSQGTQQTNCYDVDVTARVNISGRGWYSYMNRDLFDMEKYYTETAGFDCAREGNQLTLSSGNQVFTFQLLDGKWWVDENGRYLITVGPKVLLAEFGENDDYSLDFSRFADYFGCRIDVILVSDDNPDDILTLECVYGGDIKAHTNDNGVYMTGISFLDKDGPAEEADGSIVEFIGMPNRVDENDPDSDIDNGIMPDYHVEQIIVYANAEEVN